MTPTFTLPLFATPAPSAPGSRSSERGAAAVAPRRGSQRERVLLAIRQGLPGLSWPKDTPMSRDVMHRITGLPIASLCGRIAELCPVWLTVHHDACVSDAGILVDGWTLTDAGRDVVRKHLSERSG